MNDQDKAILEFHNRFGTIERWTDRLEQYGHDLGVWINAWNMCRGTPVNEQDIAFGLVRRACRLFKTRCNPQDTWIRSWLAEANDLLRRDND